MCSHVQCSYSPRKRPQGQDELIDKKEDSCGYKDRYRRIEMQGKGPIRWAEGDSLRAPEDSGGNKGGWLDRGKRKHDQPGRSGTGRIRLTGKIDKGFMVKTVNCQQRENSVPGVVRLEKGTPAKKGVAVEPRKLRLRKSTTAYKKVPWYKVVSLLKGRVFYTTPSWGKLRGGKLRHGDRLATLGEERRARVQSAQNNGGNNMPKIAPSVMVQKRASRAVLLKNGVPMNKRLKSVAKLLHAVENKVYHNEKAARRARSMMNAIGTLLQEMGALLDLADKDQDGFSYVLFDFGKFIPLNRGRRLSGVSSGKRKRKLTSKYMRGSKRSSRGWPVKAMEGLKDSCGGLCIDGVVEPPANKYVFQTWCNRPMRWQQTRDTGSF